MAISQFTDASGTTLNQYTLKETGESDRTVQLVFDPSSDYQAGTPINATIMNALVDQINANQTALGGFTLWSGTQAEYDAITTKSATTLYFIEES